MEYGNICGYFDLRGIKIPVVRYNTVVVGSGAAGYNAADSLYAFGMRDVAIITEGARLGTSRNAGSDKQTYYKLSLGGNEVDSVRQMAETLYGGGCVDGDIALCEAGLSAECFFKLVSLGVPFPRNRFGSWSGYKTDHDPRRRATSAGPYTSKLMTEKLQAAVAAKHIRVYDGLLVIRVLTYNSSEVAGVLCMDIDEARHGREAYVAFCSKNVILATGGPAGLYKDTVYPEGQHGSNGLAFEAGAGGINLTEWQYGLASRNPKWNVSGTYMQALPRFISTASDGSGGQEFLTDYFETRAELLTNVFMKGYQWPFDSEKACGGSSLIDLCVFYETLKGRRVFLDYRDNPFDGPVDFGALGGEARDYLKQAGACFGSPYERLNHMNAPAVEFYRSHGVDLSREPLEISLCAQHNNGGIAVDRWWQTCIAGLFAVGECAATHGVRRPGGSALNAGQAGSLRAAQYIAARRSGDAPPADQLLDGTGMQIAATLDCSDAKPAAPPPVAPESVAPQPAAPEPVAPPPTNADYKQPVATSQTASSPTAPPPNWTNTMAQIKTLRENMSKYACAIRDVKGIISALEYADGIYRSLKDILRMTDAKNKPQLYMLRELLISQLTYLSAFIDYIHAGGNSRGGAIYSDDNGALPHDKLPKTFAFMLDGGKFNEKIQETYYTNHECSFLWRKARPIPVDDDFFENVWRDFREGKHIDA